MALAERSEGLQGSSPVLRRVMPTPANERGLAENTVAGYRRAAGLFLSVHAPGLDADGGWGQEVVL